jgi:alkanesulfonate monooxygenase SsuD/methylene tetrahydromethanopterin reductase-like flavin-dependent oxidoreductase (luciferase family)
MKLGVFCMNLSGGTTATTVAEDRIVPTWDQNVRIAQKADAAGWEFLLPVGRWRGYGGATNWNGRQFEVFSWAAGLGAVTSRIQVFATSHVPLFHPLLAAKQAATIDQITNGRFALNIVAGWNIDEMGMFGVQQREHDERYAVADEWAEIIERLWTDEDEFDFDGSYFTMKRAYLQPKPVQRPRPILVNAGTSPAGMDFAARRCDFSFQGGIDLEELKKGNDRMRARAAEHGRHVGLLGQGVVVCADTEREAQRFFTRYVDELGDLEAGRNAVDAMLEGRTTLPDEVVGGIVRAVVAGWGGLQLVGTPEQIVEKLLQISEVGTDGLALSWLHYESGIDQFNEQILPLMVEAGLRER